MKKLKVEQHSLDWLNARCGLVTASEAIELVSPTFEIRKGQMPETLLNRKLAELRLGPLPDYMTINMEYGNILEDNAIPAYEWDYGERVERVGLITTDDGRCGCSPDGLLGDDGGIEIKCPKAETHVGYLRAGEPPKDYLPQIHFSMFVTGRAWWKFYSYHRRMPAVLHTVRRDEKIQKIMADALGLFFQKYDAALKTLAEKSGDLWKTEPPKPIDSEQENQDIIP